MHPLRNSVSGSRESQSQEGPALVSKMGDFDICTVATASVQHAAEEPHVSCFPDKIFQQYFTRVAAIATRRSLTKAVAGLGGDRQEGQLEMGKVSLGLLLLVSRDKTALILLFFPQLRVAALHTFLSANRICVAN